MKKKALLVLIAAAATGLLTGCQGKDSYKDYAKYVKLGEYKGLEVERIVYTVTEEDIQNEIENLLYSYAETIDITDRAAEDGDLVNIDYVGKIDGVEFDGGSEEDCEVEIGSDSFIDGFEEQLIGMKTGETKDITVTFPEPYDGELDGKEAVFTITMNQIFELEMPEMNDAFVKENTEYLTVAELEQGYREELQTMNDEDSNSMAVYDALYMIMDDSTISGYPEELYTETKEELKASNEATAEMFGMTIEELFGEDYNEDEAVLEYVNEKLVIYAIAEAEGLKVTDEEYQAYIDENLVFYGYETQEEFEKDYSPESTKYEILYEKVMDFLIENCKFIDVSEEEYSDGEFEEEFEDEEVLDEEESEE